jgi:hypothetical protein
MIAAADWAPLERRMSGQAEQTLLVRLHSIHVVERSQNQKQIYGHGKLESIFDRRAGSMPPIP